MRFALAAPAVATAIVGTGQLGRYPRNVQSLEQGTLSEDLFAQIRKRWNEVASPDWKG
jgi:aryl-alcohol dehydrogenase-like predicted oxidoreductase